MEKWSWSRKRHIEISKIYFNKIVDAKIYDIMRK